MQQNPLLTVRLSQRPKRITKWLTQVKLNFEEQIKTFIAEKNKSVFVENLFYTSSNYSFLGVLKLWLYDTSGSSVFLKSLKEGGKPRTKGQDSNQGILGN